MVAVSLLQSIGPLIKSLKDCLNIFWELNCLFTITFYGGVERVIWWFQFRFLFFSSGLIHFRLLDTVDEVLPLLLFEKLNKDWETLSCLSHEEVEWWSWEQDHIWVTPSSLPSGY